MPQPLKKIVAKPVKPKVELPFKLPQIPADLVVNEKTAVPARMIVSSDVHFPVHDPATMRAKLAFAKDMQVDGWMELGDLYDCWSISGYGKEPDRWYNKGRLQEEFDVGSAYWEEVCDIIGDRGNAWFVLGNHEDRLNRFLQAKQGLYGLTSLNNWHTLAGLPSQVKIYPYGSSVKIGKIHYEHGDRVGGKFGVKHRCEWVLSNRVGMNLIMGHSHKGDLRYRTVLTANGMSTYMAANLGHQSDATKQKYAVNPDWQLGFGYVEHYRVGNNLEFSFYPIHVTRGRFVFNGKVYDGR